MIVEVRKGEIKLSEHCIGNVPDGLERLCGWSDDVVHSVCIPGKTYRVGCGITELDCNPEPICEGDPILRVCKVATQCRSVDALTESDDACGTRCPASNFVCPPEGEIVIVEAPYETGASFSCNPKLVLE